MSFLNFRVIDAIIFEIDLARGINIHRYLEVSKIVLVSIELKLCFLH